LVQVFAVSHHANNNICFSGAFLRQFLDTETPEAAAAANDNVAQAASHNVQSSWRNDRGGRAVDRLLGG
jgi:hypothetical protein